MRLIPSVPAEQQEKVGFQEVPAVHGHTTHGVTVDETQYMRDSDKQF